MKEMLVFETLTSTKQFSKVQDYYNSVAEDTQKLNDTTNSANKGRI